MAGFDDSFDAAFVVIVLLFLVVVFVLYIVLPRPKPRLDVHARFAAREHQEGSCRHCLIVHLRNIGTAKANVIDLWLESASGRRESLDLLGLLPQLPRVLAPFDTLRVHVMNVDVQHAIGVLRPRQEVFRVVAQGQGALEATSGWLRVDAARHRPKGVDRKSLDPVAHRDTDRAHPHGHADFGRRMHR